MLVRHVACRRVPALGRRCAPALAAGPPSARRKHGRGPVFDFPWKHGRSPVEDTSEADEEQTRVSRLAALREQMRKSWSVADPLHLRFVASEIMYRTRVVADPDLLKMLSSAATVGAYAMGTLFVAGTIYCSIDRARDG